MKLKTHDLTLLGMFGAICCILMYFDFPIPLMPPFMSFDFSGIVEVIGGFAMGPVQAVAIIVVKLLLKLVTQGTNSAFTGEIQNFILSCAYVLPPVLLYHHKKTKKNAVIGMAVGSVLCSIVAAFSNIYLIIPFYMALMGKEMDYFVSMCTETNPFIKDVFGMVILGIVPFNLIKCGVHSVFANILYKRLSPLLHGRVESVRKARTQDEAGILD